MSFRRKPDPRVDGLNVLFPVAFCAADNIISRLHRLVTNIADHVLETVAGLQMEPIGQPVAWGFVSGGSQTPD